MIAIAVVAAAAFAAWSAFVSTGWLAGQIRLALVDRLQESLGRPVALGDVGGDLVHGIELRDLVIAEHGGFSRGVVFSADRIRLVVNLADLFLHRAGVLESITEVDLDTPRVALSRSAAGVWNLADLVGHEHGGPGQEFRGRVIVHHGIVAYRDALDLATPFVTRFAGIDGAIDLRQAQQVALDLTGRGAQGEAVALRGQYLPGAGIYDLDVTAHNGDVRHWGEYLVRLHGLRWVAGRFDGLVHVLVTPNAQGTTLDYSATVRLRNAAAEYVPMHLALGGASGGLTLDSAHVATTGLTLRANGSPVWLRGDVAYPGGVWLNLLVRSPSLDLASARALFFPRAHLGLAGRASGEVWVTGSPGAPYLDGDVTSAGGRLNRAAFTDLRTRFQYLGGVFALRDLTARVGGGTLAGAGVLDVSGGASSYVFVGTAQDMDVGALPALGLPVVDGLTGRASGDVVGSGTGGRVHVMADAAMPAGTVRGLSFEDLHTLFWDDAGAVDLDFLSTRRGATGISASGRIGSGGTLDLTLAARHVPIAEAGAWAGLGKSQAGSLGVGGWADLEGRLTGTVHAPVVSGAVTAWDGHLGPVPFGLASGDITVSSTAIRARRLRLVDGTARYQVNGGLRFRPLAAEHLSIDAEQVPAAPLTHALLSSAQMTGMLTGRLSADGPLDHPAFAGQLTLTRGSVGAQPVDQADAQFTGSGRVVHLSRLQARVNGARVAASGTVDLRGPLDLAVSVDNVRLSDLEASRQLGIVPLGTVAFSGSVVGTVRDPEVRGTLSSPDFSLHGQAFTASGTVDYRDSLLEVSPLELAQGDARYRVSGWIRMGSHPSADLTFAVDHGEIATVVAAAGLDLPVPLDGTIDGTVGLSGPLADPAARLALTMRDGRVGGVPIGTGTADLTLRHGTVDIQKLELTPGRGRLAAKGRVELRGTSAVEVSGSNLDSNVLRPLFHTTQPLEGALNFTIQWSGPTRDPTAGLSIEALNAGVPGAIADRIVGLAYYKDGILHIEDGLIEKGTGKVVIQGTLPAALGGAAPESQGPLDLQLSLQDADLSLLSLFLPAIQDASGTIAGQVAVGGTMAAPEMSGVVRSQGGQFRFAPLRTPIENVSADIAFSQSEVLVRALSATVGGGQIESHGSVAIKDLRPETVSLDLTARNLNVDVPGLYTGGVDASLGLTGPATRPVLAGTVTVSHGQAALATAVGPGAPNPLPVALDVAIVAGPGVVYAAGPVHVQIGGRLHVGGTIGHPALSGQIQSLGGTVVVLGTPFTVTQGQVTLSEASSLEPLISARAQGMYGTTTVFLDVNGVLPQPTLTWSSDPPLSQDQILSLVAGSTGAQSSPAQLLSQILLGSVGQAIQQALRLDEFTITYDTQNPVTLRIGKFIVRNVYLSVAEVIGRPAAGTVPGFGSITRLNPTGQSYTILGLQYFLSPSVYLAYNVDSLGDNGVFLLARLPF